MNPFRTPFTLVLLLVCVVCVGLPLLVGGYLRGTLNPPKWILTVLAFASMALIAILYTRPSARENPAFYSAPMILYIIVGYFLRQVYGRKQWRTAMLLAVLANGFGLLGSFLVVSVGLANGTPPLTLAQNGLFLVIAQGLVAMAYFLAPDRLSKKADLTKKKKK